MNGIERGIPTTVVARSHAGVLTAHFGWKVIASKARMFSRMVISPSAPPSM
jgi:hypothetical protein